MSIKFSIRKDSTNKKLSLYTYPWNFSLKYKILPWKYRFKSKGLEWWGVGLIIGNKRFNVDFISRVTKQNLQIK